MNATSADAFGLTTVLDPFAAPAASVREPAPRGWAFEKVLTERPKEAATSERRRNDEEVKADESNSPSVEDRASEEVAGEVVAQVEESAESTDDGRDEEPAIAAEVIVAPMVVLPELPQGIEPAAESETEAESESVPIEADGTTQSAPQVVAAATNVGDVAAPVAEAGPAAAPSEAESTDSQEGSDPSISIEATTSHIPFSSKTDDEFATALAEAPTDSRDDESSRESTSKLTGSDDVAKQPEIDLRAIQDAMTAAPTTDQSKPDVAAVVRSETSPSASPVNNAAANAPPQPTTRLPTEVLVDAAARPAAAEQPVTVDSARLLHRVARAFAAAQDGSGEVRLRLSPPELGALRLDVRVQDGALVARLETETSAARTALIDNLPALRERLSEQGVRIERFEVSLMQRDASGTPDRPADRQPPEQPAPQPAVRSRRLPQVAEGVVARSTQYTDHDLRRLNVVV
jgi:flagellar hook-length control protein FliK